ncbi:MAG: hypothetical protein N3F66_14745, partial [Spirochaetes bacterium]|nr:hypothetical protein [Spirochaetota bacterium]
LSFIKLQNDALLTFRFFVDTALGHKKNFFSIKSIQSNKIIKSLKKRYTALIESISNPKATNKQ